MASIEYRLTPSITFPANVEDVRTAVRWLKANAAAHALDAERICLWGTSAGGHLAAVAGLAPPGMFEGTDNLTYTSSVRCVLDAYGPTRFDVMDAQTAEERANLQPAVISINIGRGARGAAPAAGAPGGVPADGRGGRGSVPHDDPASAGVAAPGRTCSERAGPRSRRQSDDLHREGRAAVSDHAWPRGRLGAARSERHVVRRAEGCGKRGDAPVDRRLARTPSSIARIWMTWRARSRCRCASTRAAGLRSGAPSDWASSTSLASSSVAT